MQELWLKYRSMTPVSELFWMYCILVVIENVRTTA